MLGVRITFLDLCQWDFEALWSLNRQRLDSLGPKNSKGCDSYNVFTFFRVIISSGQFHFKYKTPIIPFINVVVIC